MAASDAQNDHSVPNPQAVMTIGDDGQGGPIITITAENIANMNINQVNEMIDTVGQQENGTDSEIFRLLMERQNVLIMQDQYNAGAPGGHNDARRIIAAAQNPDDENSPLLNPAQTGTSRTTGDRMIHLNQTPTLSPFTGKQDEDWPKFRRKVLTLFQTIEVTDEMAAVQFCTYLDGNAYKFWESLPEATTKNLKETFKAFDKKYADEIQQGYWQIKYENLTYAGPEKESLDELVMRIQDVVKKAFPDYIDEVGNKTSKLQTRQIYAKKKFWDLMAPEIKEQLFIKFKGSDAPLQEQLDFARILQAAKIRANKEEQSYETICHIDYQQPDYEVLAELQKQGRQIENISKNLSVKKQDKPPLDKNKVMQHPQGQPRTGQPPRQGTINPNIQCYNRMWEKLGHINRYCPYQQNQQPQALLPTPPRPQNQGPPRRTTTMATRR